jgi:hypothetical protein
MGVASVAAKYPIVLRPSGWIAAILYVYILKKQPTGAKYTSPDL